MIPIIGFMLGIFIIVTMVERIVQQFDKQVPYAGFLITLEILAIVAIAALIFMLYETSKEAGEALDRFRF